MRLLLTFGGLVLIYLILFSSLVLISVREDDSVDSTAWDEAPSVAKSSLPLSSPPSSSGAILNVLDLGAVGDGVADDTQAIRRALRSSSERTGATVVWLPSGFTFRSGPLNLTSHTTFRVDGVLKAIRPNETNARWPWLPPLENYGNSRDGKSEVTANGREPFYFYWQHQAFLYAAFSENVTITGKGVIDGSGPYWWDLFQQDQYKTLLKAGRPNLIQFVRCQYVEISFVTLRDSPFWCLHPVLSRYIHIHHVTIRSKMHAPNSDGIDPDSSQHVLIEHNDVSVGDDHIAVKAGVCGFSSPLSCSVLAKEEFETANVTIRKNVFRTGMGVAIGSEGSGGIRNVLVEDNRIGVCSPGYCPEGCCGWGFGIHIKTTDTRGGYYTDLVFRNNTIYNSTKAILLETSYQTKYNGTLTKNPTRMENVLFENIRKGGTANRMRIACSKELPCKNLKFVNNDFK